MSKSARSPAEIGSTGAAPDPVGGSRYRTKRPDGRHRAHLFVNRPPPDPELPTRLQLSTALQRPEYRSVRWRGPRWQRRQRSRRARSVARECRSEPMEYQSTLKRTPGALSEHSLSSSETTRVRFSRRSSDGYYPATGQPGWADITARVAFDAETGVALRWTSEHWPKNSHRSRSHSTYPGPLRIPAVTCRN